MTSDKPTDRLIKAAPLMLRALQAVRACWLENREVDDTTIALVGAAIEAAEGRLESGEPE